jgi:cytochrome c553
VQFLSCKGRWAFLLTALFISTSEAQDRLASCAGCHGPDGNSVTMDIPSIAGQPKLFIENQLVLYRDGMRESDAMFAALKGMKDPEIIQLALHFSKLRARPVPGVADKSLFQKGQALAKNNRCGICHLADYRGQNQVPRLARQREEYLLSSLRAFRDNKRRGGDTIMAASLYGIGDADLAALAHYLARSR